MLYVAHLTGGKFYVGHTDHYKQRAWQHYHRLGSKITQKYPPLKNGVKFLGLVPHAMGKRGEVLLVNKLRKKYGYNNVRGGYSEHAYNF